MRLEEKTKYVSLEKAIESTLRELGGSARLEDVLQEVWKRYVRSGSKKVVMRLYKSPAGRVWSPEAEEALRILEEAGVVVRRGDKIYLVSNGKP